jgi:thiamine kinase-like enzyme
LRLDNILFSDRAGRAVIVDWQTVSAGTPMADVAYCIGTSFASPDERQSVEKGLVENYIKQLDQYNNSAYPLEQAWEDYRFFSFSGWSA